MKDRFHRLAPSLVIAIVVGVVVARLATLLRYDLWYDELYSLFAALGEPGELWTAAVHDRVHPPLFYMTLWGWLKVVDPTPTALRLLPLLLFAGCLVAIWWSAKAAGLSLRGRAIAVLAVAINPILFDAGADLRGYSLLALLVAIMLGAALNLLRPDPMRHSVAILLASAVLATWTHYFAWPSVAALVLILAVHGRRREATLLAVVPAVASVPWVWALLHDSRVGMRAQLQWGHSPGLRDLLLLPGTLIGDRSPVVVMAIAAVLGWLMLLLSLREGRSRALLLSVAAPPIAVLAAGMLFGLGSWDPRYLVGAVVPLALLIGTWSDAPQRWLHAAVAMLLLCSGIAAATPAAWRIPWRTITHQLAERSPGAPVYAFDGFTVLPLRYYARMDGLALSVSEVKQFPDVMTPGGWIVVRPITLMAGPDAASRLRTAGRTVVDSLNSGSASNWIAAFRFQ